MESSRAAAHAIDLIQGPRRAAAVLHPLRRRILEDLREPASAAALSRRLGIARQKLNYHLRALEKQKLVELVEERRKGNCIERIVRATARSYLISPEVLGSLAGSPDAIEDRFSAAYLAAVAGRAIRDVAVLGERARAAGKRLATFTLQAEVRFAGPRERKEFFEALANATARLVAKYHDERAAGGRRHRLFVGAYPALREAEPRTDPRKEEQSS